VVGFGPDPGSSQKPVSNSLWVQKIEKYLNLPPALVIMNPKPAIEYPTWTCKCNQKTKTPECKEVQI
jgi:hypothetical protein